MKGKRRPRLTIIIVCGIALAIMLPSLFIYTHFTDKQLQAYIAQTLNEISSHNVSSINDKINSDLILMDEIAGSASLSNEGFSGIIGRLSATAGQHGFKRMGIVDKKGNVYCTDGASLNIIDEDHIVRAFAGQSVLSDVFQDDIDGKNIFVYTVPVYDETSTTVKGVLFATCDTTSFRVHLSETAFNGEGYSYIVKTNGNTVTDSIHPSSFKNMTNVFQSMLASGDNKKAVDKMSADMAEGLQGSVVFTNTGVRKYMNYEALGINDWYILSVVPADVMNGNRNNIMFLTYVAIAVILFATLLLTVTIILGEKSRNKQLEEVLYVDPLTGGITFTKFCLDAPKMIEKSTDKAACVMADLDNFKLINNLYGHAEGDKTLLHTYKVFKNIIGNNGLLTRRVADRFYALIFFKDEEELNNTLLSFITKLKTSWNNNNDADYILSPSIGVCIVNGSEDIETTANNATIAHDGIDRNSGCIAFYDDVQRDRMMNNKVLEDKMVYAHKNHEFVPFLQPKYDVQTGKICGAEALVRWRNSDGSITYPDRFIPLAERNGFIRVLDRDMFEAVCKLQRMIIDSKLRPVPISVNVSRQLMYETSFADDYINILKRYGLSPDTIELEITESVLFDDFDGFRLIIDTLRNNGFRILMDDFGTGYSSLMMLSSVPIDNLKLDKSFIDRFEDDKGKKIINCVIELAKSLQLPITAEGVETSSQCEFLKERGCNIIQGYFFSRPVPQERFVDLLKQNMDDEIPTVIK